METKANETLSNIVTETISAQTSSVIAQLSVEQQAALESKLLTLPIEVRSSLAAKYPALSNVEAYIVRQMVKESNGKLASNKRPIWYSILNTNAASIGSTNKDVAAWAKKQLMELAEELDTKESIGLLRKYKVSKDTNSKDPHIIMLCGIFGVSSANLA
jgi:hypothetical protein